MLDAVFVSRKSVSARISCSVKLNRGMTLPGVTACGLRKWAMIHSASWRLPTSSSGGPTFPPLPPMLWQPMQPFSANNRRPASRPGSVFIET